MKISKLIRVADRFNWVNKTIREVLLFLIAAILISPCSQAGTLKEAMDEAAEYFTKRAVKLEAGQELHIIEIVNLSSGQNDTTGKQIETELYFALERQFPDFKLFLGRGENRKREVYLTGNYLTQGNEATVKFRILKGKEILAQTEVVYTIKSHSEALVAVLDLEADALSANQRKAYSDIFRSALTDTAAFNLASSADVDKMNPDEIQQATGCSRDACATIIGEQLGVDRVISSSLFQVSENEFILSGKILDIKDGSVLVSKTVEFEGERALKKLKPSLRALAYQIAGKVEEKRIEKESSSSLIWHGTAIGIALVSALMSRAEAGGYNNLAETNSELETKYNSAGTQAELTRIEKEYDANSEQMGEHKKNIQLYDAITIAAILWEGYLLFSSSFDSSEQSFKMNSNGWPRVSIRLTHGNATPVNNLIFGWRW